jgi:hypothetical protein
MKAVMRDNIKSKKLNNYWAPQDEVCTFLASENVGQWDRRCLLHQAQSSCERIPLEYRRSWSRKLVKKVVKMKPKYKACHRVRGQMS